MSAVKSNGVFQSTPIRGIPLTRRSIVVTPLSETPDLVSLIFYVLFFSIYREK